MRTMATGSVSILNLRKGVGSDSVGRVVRNSVEAETFRREGWLNLKSQPETSVTFSPKSGGIIVSFCVLVFGKHLVECQLAIYITRGYRVHLCHVLHGTITTLKVLSMCLGEACEFQYCSAHPGSTAFQRKRKALKRGESRMR